MKNFIKRQKRPQKKRRTAGQLVTWTNVGWATVAGLSAGVLVGLITSYYTSMEKAPVDSIAEQSKTGTATNIIAGLGVGMQSTALPILVIAGGVVIAAEVAGLYGVAIAALGMLSTTGIQLAVDAYGPIPADSLFNRSFHGYLTMFHDQAMIYLKSRKNGLNFTLGLPIIRLSPLYGAALDIAGKGIAEISGLETAIKRSILLYRNARKYERSKSSH